MDTTRPVLKLADTLIPILLRKKNINLKPSNVEPLF